MSFVKEQVDFVPRLYWSAPEAAARLGISWDLFMRFRKAHAFYRHDCEKPGRGRVKNYPMWRDDHLRLIAVAWTVTPQGVRTYTDDEGLAILTGLREREREEYLQLSGNA